MLQLVTVKFVPLMLPVTVAESNWPVPEETATAGGCTDDGAVVAPNKVIVVPEDSMEVLATVNAEPLIVYLPCPPVVPEVCKRTVGVPVTLIVSPVPIGPGVRTA